MKIEHLQQFSDTLTPGRVCRVAQGARFRCAPDLRASAPPREPVWCTQRRGARGGRAHTASAFDSGCNPAQPDQSLWELL